MAKAPTGQAAIAEYQKQVSAKGMAAAEKSALKALAKKYPDIYMPKTRVAKSADEARARQIKKYGK